MLRRRFPFGVVLPALLIGLVGVLATFQYRWLGQVSEAERAQLSRSLTERARELTEDFDRELTRLYFALQMSRQSVADRAWEAFAGSYDAWRRTARHPQVVRAIYLAEWNDSVLTLRPYDDAGRRFADTPLAAWPAHLEPLRKQLEHEPSVHHMPGAPTAIVSQSASSTPPGRSTVRVVAMAVSAVATDVPALVIPLANPVNGSMFAPAVGAQAGPTPSSTVVRWLDLTRSSVIVDLDDRYLSTVVLPALADRYFPSGGAGGYRLAVTTPSGATKFQRGFAPGVTVDAAKADVTMPLFTLRPDLLPDTLRELGVPVPHTSGATPPAANGASVAITRSAPSAQYSFFIASDGKGGPMPTVRARLQSTRPGWTLLLQHGAGSLDAAVSQARLRNLWLSFTILGVLAVGVLLVVANARRSEQLASRRMDFVATVSHELRTPLAVIRSAAQNLAAGVVSDPAQARRYGELIEGEGRRLTDMVEQVMDYAALEGQSRVRSPRPVDVLGLVEEVAASCRPLCEAAGCVLDVDLGDPEQEVPSVMGDEAALGRVMANLMSNAAKHGADGRWIGVKASACLVRNGREIQVTVSDRGRGIDAAELAHIFEPFGRGRHAIDQQIHGNGLGLTLVKRIVEAHGGRVAVTSTPGQGATFAIYLPADPAAPASESGSPT